MLANFKESWIVEIKMYRIEKFRKFHPSNHSSIPHHYQLEVVFDWGNFFTVFCVSSHTVDA